MAYSIIFRKFLLALTAILVVVGGFAGSLQSASAQDFAAACAQYHTIQRGETLYRISQRYNTSVANLQSLNGIRDANRIYAGQTLCVAVSAAKTHTVAAGETLTRIARYYGVSMTVLAQVNNITNVNLIYVGQVLKIPDFTIQ